MARTNVTSEYRWERLERADADQHAEEFHIGREGGCIGEEAAGDAHPPPALARRVSEQLELSGHREQFGKSAAGLRLAVDDDDSLGDAVLLELWEVVLDLLRVLDHVEVRRVRAEHHERAARLRCDHGFNRHGVAAGDALELEGEASALLRGCQLDPSRRRQLRRRQQQRAREPEAPLGTHQGRSAVRTNPALKVGSPNQISEPIADDFLNKVKVKVGVVVTVSAQSMCAVRMLLVSCAVSAMAEEDGSADGVSASPSSTLSQGLTFMWTTPILRTQLVKADGKHGGLLAQVLFSLF